MSNTKRIKYALFFISTSTLLLEITLTKVFDVILNPNMSYMVVSSAMFAFGLAGIFLSTFTLKIENISSFLAKLAMMFGIFSILLLPALNYLPFDYEEISVNPVMQLLFFSCMYLFLIIPFFLSGLMISLIFTHFPEEIQTLYFWDLIGAGIGCILFVPLIASYGPGGMLFIVMAACLLTCMILYEANRKITVGVSVVGIMIMGFPLTQENYIDFVSHINKRGVVKAQKKGKIEYSRWDPISKIDIIPLNERWKHIAYDGGQQSSYYIEFDGDYTKLKDLILNKQYRDHYGDERVLVSHYFKRNREPDVLIIGAAGGRELLGALAFGAKNIDAIELVKTVVRLGKYTYNDLIGNIFNHPNVHYIAGEGRSYLRSSEKKYDIIQIFSNHNSSSIAMGTGAMNPNFLQTAEAYREYYMHLKPDGVLQINHHNYPRMLTTASLGWKKLGKNDFSKHVLVIQHNNKANYVDTLPTMLIKMSPWEKKQIDDVYQFFDPDRYFIAFHPIEPDNNLVPEIFLNPPLQESVTSRVDYVITPATDDRPYFNFFRKRMGRIDEESSQYIDWATLKIINGYTKRGIIPMDIIHLIVTGIMALFFSILFIFFPLLLSPFGRGKWKGKVPTLVYFSCLGAGFIIIELVFIQIFMQMIGYPVFTYVTVISTTLVSAGIGSMISGKFELERGNKWIIIFIGILLFGALFTLFYPMVFQYSLASPLAFRILISIMMIFPLGFFMGMPFPLGILAIKGQEYGAIPWAWGMNGFFTITGGLLSVVLSLFFGFRITLVLAILIYSVAFYTYGRLRVASLAA